MSFDWTVFLFPLFLIALFIGQKGVISSYARARAFSEQTARRPGSLKIENHDLVRDAVAKGKLIATGDGRYYLDAARFRRRQKLLRATFLIVVVAGLAELVFVLAMRTS